MLICPGMISSNLLYLKWSKIFLGGKVTLVSCFCSANQCRKSAARVRIFSNRKGEKGELSLCLSSVLWSNNHLSRRCILFSSWTARSRLSGTWHKSQTLTNWIRSYGSVSKERKTQTAHRPDAIEKNGNLSRPFSNGGKPSGQLLCDILVFKSSQTSRWLSY